MKPGRTRLKLAALLEAALNTWEKAHRMPGLALKFTVNPIDLYDSKGAYRTDVRQDCCRWDGFARFENNGQLAANFQSYDTMTKCVAKGIVLTGGDGLSFDVHSNS